MGTVPENKHARPNDDFWKRWRKDAIRTYDRASSEYIRSKSFYERYVKSLREKGILERLPWYKRWALKGAATLGEAHRYGMALLASMGESAARLAPDTKQGMFLDLATTIGPLAALKAAKAYRAIRLARLEKPLKGATYKALVDLWKTVGEEGRAARLIKMQAFRNARLVATARQARNIIAKVKTAKKVTEVAHSAHIIEKSAHQIYHTLAAEHSKDIHKSHKTKAPPPARLANVPPSRARTSSIRRRTTTPPQRPGASLASFKQPPLSQATMQETMRKASSFIISFTPIFSTTSIPPHLHFRTSSGR